jgi:class 3 adenylate cyclase/tetratricopeptide (TPR) repeat protein
MKRLLILLTTLAALWHYPAAARSTPAYRDSLKTELAKTGQDTNRLWLLRDLANASGNVPDEGLEYCRQGLALANKLKNKKFQAAFLHQIAANHFGRGEHKEAIEFNKRALKLAQEADRKLLIAEILLHIGRSYIDMGSYGTSYEYLSKARKAYAVANDTLGEAESLSALAGVYQSQGNLAKALEYRTTALAMVTDLGEKFNRAQLLVAVGATHSQMGNYTKAIEYLELGKAAQIELGSKGGVANALFNIANTYAEQKNYKKAADYFLQTVALAQEVDDKSLQAYVFANIGSIYLELAKENISKNGERHGVNTDISANLKRSVYFFDKAISIASELGHLHVLESVHQKLAEAYELSGDYKLAYEAHQKYATIHDSVFNEETTARIAKAEMESEYGKKQLADSLKNAEQTKIATLKLQKQKTYTYLGFVGIIVLIGVSLWIFRNSKKLSFEKKKSEDLLLNILPEEITTELKQRGAITATNHDDVTILFTDFVNFTLAGERMGSRELVGELHHCFKAFDEIIARHGIEKIKTIGDAYLAVCGLPASDEKHAEKIANAALDIRDFMLQRRKEMGENTFEIRIGIHSGSVVAGIVGIRKFAYDIWGDTVNIAARMEQHGFAGKINISQSTYELLKDKFSCKFRGELDVKNKGMQRMYFLEHVGVTENPLVKREVVS